MSKGLQFKPLTFIYLEIRFFLSYCLIPVTQWPPTPLRPKPPASPRPLPFGLWDPEESRPAGKLSAAPLLWPRRLTQKSHAFLSIPAGRNNSYFPPNPKSPRSPSGTSRSPSGHRSVPLPAESSQSTLRPTPRSAQSSTECHLCPEVSPAPARPDHPTLPDAETAA